MDEPEGRWDGGGVVEGWLEAARAIKGLSGHEGMECKDVGREWLESMWSRR